MHITMRTNLALRTLMFCAVNDGKTVRKSDIAKACNASENHLGQIVRTLGQHGFVEIARGRKGGLKLAGPADRINIGAVFRLFERDLPFAECFGPANTCPLLEGCWLRRAIENAVNAFYASLDNVRLSDLVAGNGRLFSLLNLDQTTPRGKRPDACFKPETNAAG